MAELCNWCYEHVQKHESITVNYCDKFCVVHKKCEKSMPVTNCGVCKQSGYNSNVSWENTEYGFYHKSCLPQTSDSWWPIIHNSSDFKTKGKQLTQEVKNVMIYIYWILRYRFRLPRDIVYYIMGISIYPHGQIAHIQNKIPLTLLCKLIPSAFATFCERCRYYYDSNVKNYKIYCYNGPCVTCGTPHCKDNCNYAVCISPHRYPDVKHELMNYPANYYQTNAKLKYLALNNLVTPEEKEQIYIYFTHLAPKPIL